MYKKTLDEIALDLMSMTDKIQFHSYDGYPHMKMRYTLQEAWVSTDPSLYVFQIVLFGNSFWGETLEEAMLKLEKHESVARKVFFKQLRDELFRERLVFFNKIPDSANSDGHIKIWEKIPIGIFFCKNTGELSVVPYPEKVQNEIQQYYPIFKPSDQDRYFEYNNKSFRIGDFVKVTINSKVAFGSIVNIVPSLNLVCLVTSIHTARTPINYTLEHLNFFEVIYSRFEILEYFDKNITPLEFL